jgi:hypothetical protein
VTANPPGSDQQFTGWTGDVSILANPAAAMTTATIPLSNVSIRATYAGGTTGGPEKIRYHPRSGFGARMVGGVFEGSNGSKDTGPYTLLYTIVTEPSGWTEVDASLGGFRYLRYRSPSGGFCNVAEVEFYRNGNKLGGPGFGTPGSFSGRSSDAYGAALDGDTSTFFDSNQGSNAYVGIDTGASLYTLTVNKGSERRSSSERPAIFNVDRRYRHPFESTPRHNLGADSGDVRRSYRNLYRRRQWWRQRGKRDGASGSILQRLKQFGVPTEQSVRRLTGARAHRLER